MRYWEKARNRAKQSKKVKGGEETRLTQPRITRRLIFLSSPENSSIMVLVIPIYKGFAFSKRLSNYCSICLGFVYV